MDFVKKYDMSDLNCFISKPKDMIVKITRNCKRIPARFEYPSQYSTAYRRRYQVCVDQNGSNQRCQTLVHNAGDVSLDVPSVR